MEFQESLMRFVVHKKPTVLEKNGSKEITLPDRSKLKQKWRISFYRSSSSSSSSATTEAKRNQTEEPIPKEFTCSISGSLMADPVIVSSGHTFERRIVDACVKLGFVPTLFDGTKPDFSNVIPNLALKSTISNFCERVRVELPKPLDFDSAEKILTDLMESGDKGDVLDEKVLIDGVSEKPEVKKVSLAATSEVSCRKTRFYTSSDESVGTRKNDSTRPLPLAIQPSCYTETESTSNETEIEIINRKCAADEDDDEIVTKLNSSDVHEIEEALIRLRNQTRTIEESRASLCTPKLLSVLRSLIHSRYTTIQVNSVAALVNLSLEKTNKVKMVRSGIVLPLIDVLKGGSQEAQEHAAGVLFSLAQDDDNKTVLGVLGALQPLLHALRSNCERTRNDSALALYHLTLVQSNRSKLIKLGAVQSLLGMAKSGQLLSRVMLILCNLAACPSGRTAMLDAGAVECLVGMLKGDELNELNSSTRESCVVALYGLSQGGLRFRGLALASGAVEVLRKVEITGKERAREKAKRILEAMKVRAEVEEEVDWEELIDSGLAIRNRGRVGCGLDESGVFHSSQF